MKKLLLMAAVCLLAVQMRAAEEDWLTNLPQALAKAKAENKVVLMDFTGSDWCPPCKALHKNVLTSAEFDSYAKTNLVLMLVDFPNHKPQTDELKQANQELQKKYGIEGYPTLIVLGADGKVLYKNVGYGGEATKSVVEAIDKAKQKAKS